MREPWRESSILCMQRIEYATLELARAAGLRVCSTRLESVGTGEALIPVGRSNSPTSGHPKFPHPVTV